MINRDKRYLFLLDIVVLWLLFCVDLVKIYNDEAYVFGIYSIGKNVFSNLLILILTNLSFLHARLVVTRTINSMRSFPIITVAVCGTILVHVLLNFIKRDKLSNQA